MPHKCHLLQLLLWALLLLLLLFKHVTHTKLNFANFWIHVLAKMELLSSYIHTYKTLLRELLNELSDGRNSIWAEPWNDVEITGNDMDRDTSCRSTLFWESPSCVSQDCTKAHIPQKYGAYWQRVPSGWVTVCVWEIERLEVSERWGWKGRFEPGEHHSETCTLELWDHMNPRSTSLGTCGLGKLLNLSVLQFPHSSYGNNSSAYLIGW